MRRLELLSPAKNLDCGLAAIDHGADAVYIGARRFGARAAAGNSTADIARLCRHAHIFGAKVYVTVNTIIFDDEIDQTLQLLGELDECGADAVLFQDMGLYSLFRDMGLQMAAHASTQTDNRTADKVAWLGSLGFSRVVLARELSVKEIGQIHARVPEVELEAFVHGALCVSYSGQCYASQHCFGRSANRGECAQFCRMKFDLVDADGQTIESGRHLLSLGDLCLHDHIEQLADAGVTSFKIEGRLKDVDYVKNVTAAYSRQLDRLVASRPDHYVRASRGRSVSTFTPDLEKTFHRGYTTYFFNGRQPGIASLDTPKAVGQYVGVVKDVRRDSLSVAGTARFANGDGLCFMAPAAGGEGPRLEGFRVNRVDAAGRLYPQHMPRQLRPGMRLWRNQDQEFQRVLSRPSAERKMAVEMELRPTPDGFALSLGVLPRQEGLVFEATAICQHQEAQKPQRDNIVRQLTKLGGTPFSCDRVVLPEGADYFLPSSTLAELRRSVVEKALDGLAQRRPTPPREPGPQLPPPERYAAHYLYNIANTYARRFYNVPDPPAGHSSPKGEAAPGGPLMQCRHCLRYTLGACVRHGGRRPAWREPLTLVLGDGRRFPLEFDCARCQMNVYAK